MLLQGKQSKNESFFDTLFRMDVPDKKMQRLKETLHNRVVQQRNELLSGADCKKLQVTWMGNQGFCRQQMAEIQPLMRHEHCAVFPYNRFVSLVGGAAYL